MSRDWRVIRYDVKVGEVYDAVDDEGHVRKCRVVKVTQDNTDSSAWPEMTLKPYVEVVVRHEDGMPDRTLRGPEVDFYLRQRTA